MTIHPALPVKIRYTDNGMFIGTSLIFLYIFYFYIIGPVTSSILAALIVFPYFLRRKAFKSLYASFCSKYIIGIFAIILGLISLCIAYSLAHQTYDLSYAKILFAQAIHIICGVIVLGYLKYKYDFDIQTIIKIIIWAYLIQSLIEIVASCTPAIASIVTYFSRAESDQEKSGGVRGLALASGTTWSLGLTYGMAFILYVHHFMLDKLNFKIVIGWFLLVLGTFFAGRTGFVGAAISLAYFFLFSKINIIKRASLPFYFIGILLGIAMLMYILFPDYTEYMITTVLPWAIEPLLNYLDGKGLSSASTDVLDTMWDRPMTDMEFLFGTGFFTGIDGKYYLHTDVGVLRNLFYWGIGGYMSLIFYQIYTMYPLFKNGGKYIILGLMLLLYLSVCEYKAVTIGLNKMAFSMLFVMSFFSQSKTNDKHHHTLLQRRTTH